MITTITCPHGNTHTSKVYDWAKGDMTTREEEECLSCGCIVYDKVTFKR